MNHENEIKEFIKFCRQHKAEVIIIYSVTGNYIKVTDRHGKVFGPYDISSDKTLIDSLTYISYELECALRATYEDYNLI